MVRRWLPVGIAVVVLLVNSAVALADNQGNKNQQERRDDERIRQAQQAVESVRKELNAAEKSLRDALHAADAADTRQDKAKIAVQKAKERAETQLEGSAGIRAAIDKMKAAEEALAKAAEPILTTLHQSAEYGAADKAAQAAKERLKSIRTDISLDESERDAELSALNRAIQAPRKLEQTATEGDASCRAAKAALEAAQQEVARLRETVRERLEQQPEVKQAIADLADATRDLAQAQKKAAAARQQVTQHRRELANKQQAVDSAKAADKRNDKNNKPKNKK